MNYRTGYYKEDFSVFYKLCDVDDRSDDRVTEPFFENYYFMLYVFQGSAYVKKGNERFHLTDGQMILIDANTYLTYHFDTATLFEYMLIRLHPSIFSNYYDDPEFNRAFRKPYNSDSLVYITNNTELAQNISSIRQCLNLHLGRAHIIPRVYTLISDLCIRCDAIQGVDNLTTDSLPLQIIEHINRHYLEKLTYQSLSEQFFVSKTTIINLLHKYTIDSFRRCMALHEYINYLRLRDAQEMLSRGWSAQLISQLCGFGSYSTFFRAYKQFYGVSPVQNKDVSKKKWPLTR